MTSKQYDNGNLTGGAMFKVRENEDEDERVSLAPLTFEEALTGLLATPRSND